MRTGQLGRISDLPSKIDSVPTLVLTTSQLTQVPTSRHGAVRQSVGNVHTGESRYQSGLVPRTSIVRAPRPEVHCENRRREARVQKGALPKP